MFSPGSPIDESYEKTMHCNSIYSDDGYFVCDNGKLGSDYIKKDYVHSIEVVQE
jgi:hypothetical protein